jgi:hypothetical protein
MGYWAVPPTPQRIESRQLARARELTLHAAILAAIVWAAVAADVISPGPLGRFSGFQKGNDFVQFYVAGTLARHGDFAALVDAERFRAAQRPFLPPNDNVSFPPVYGPQVALFLAPFTLLSYVASYAVWSFLTIGVTFWSTSILRRESPSLVRWRWPVAAATAAYPAFGYLVLDGQLSAIALVAVTLAVLALARRSSVAAGAALGLLGYKASLFVPALAVVVVAGEWRIAAVGALTAVAQLVLPAAVTGPAVPLGFLDNLRSFARDPDALTRNSYLMASFRTFWSALLVPRLAALAYVGSAALSVGVAAWSWRRTTAPLERIAVVVLAATLASPHLFIYDLVILGPAFVASASILVTRSEPALRWSTWLAFFAPLTVPLAAVSHVQIVTLIHTGWLVAFAAAVGCRPQAGGNLPASRGTPTDCQVPARTFFQ